MVVATCGLLLIHFILQPCQALNTAAGESTNTTTRHLQQDTRCECQDKSLQCPDIMLSNFEDTADIREEGDRALWALECSDSICNQRCKKELQKMYGTNGYCACVNEKAFHMLSKQSLTLLAMQPSQILQACFGDQCA